MKRHAQADENSQAIRLMRRYFIAGLGFPTGYVLVVLAAAHVLSMLFDAVHRG